MLKDNYIRMIVEKTKTGFSAYSDKYSIYTSGKSIPELINNAYEAASLYFSEKDQKVNQQDIKFEIDFQQFFQYYKVINARFLAERIGMHPSLLSQYVNGHKKPSDKQSHKILKGIQQIGQELAGINLL